MLDRIDMPDLTTFSQPEWNDARHLSAAFVSILTANNEESSLNAYPRLLYAVGNDHAGTYYSVALGILPIIERILRDGSPWSQHTVLEVLIELYGSFNPEPGQELYRGSPFEKLLKQGISDLAPLASAIENDGKVAAKGARELLELIHDQSR
jgi:hypothetical protein